MKNLKLIPLAAAMAALALPASAAASLSAPGLVGPANGAHFQELPAISWQPVRRAAEYEYEISADSRFHSILGSGPGQGTTQTHNLAAALARDVPDGRYWWRVRGVTASGTVGRWSRVRSMVKRWSAAPRLLGGDGTSVTWPSTALALDWSSVPYAVKYIVTIATDPALSSQVLGSPSHPQYTDGTSFVLPGTLANGTYYWAVTPVDAENETGVRSRVGSFTWSWPTSTTLNCVSELLAAPSGCPATAPGQTPILQDPLLSWAPIPGAASYDVEINSSPNFPAGSKWCCSTPTIGTSLAPTRALANDSSYWWRVRALDANGHAGQWNNATPAGQPAFTKAFDAATPSIPNLTVRDAYGNVLTGVPSTDTPIVTWSPVPGASRYEFELGAWNGSYCDFSVGTLYKVDTSTTAWTPFGNPGIYKPGPLAWPSPQHDIQPPSPNATYCARVLARSDDDAQGQQVVSAWTYVNGTNNSNAPAFFYAPQPASIAQPFAPFVPAGTYVQPSSGALTPRTPLLTWQWTPGAMGYFVVISRDAGFTDIADVGFTNVPAYAPRLGNSAPLADKSTAYYWAVIPTQTVGGSGYNDAILGDNPVTFNKSSVPPSLIQPSDGANVSTWPTFQWTPAENARNYTLQVSADPSFGNPIDNVTTDATAYTSSSTYPADTSLYWRVRGNDWIGQGLNWSAVQTFTRRLPSAVPAPGNPTAGELEPTFSWSLVPGAIAYDVSIDEGNGVIVDSTVDSPAAAPTTHHGIGTVHWQVRPLFPTTTGATVGGGFSPALGYLLKLGPPAGARGTKSGSRIVISWRPDPAAKDYQVDVSSTDSFSTIVDQQRVDGTTWAPSINPALPAARGRLYWRVAAVSSDGFSIGSYATGSFGPARSHHRRGRR